MSINHEAMSGPERGETVFTYLLIHPSAAAMAIELRLSDAQERPSRAWHHIRRASACGSAPAPASQIVARSSKLEGRHEEAVRRGTLARVPPHAGPSVNAVLQAGFKHITQRELCMAAPGAALASHEAPTRRGATTAIGSAPP